MYIGWLLSEANRSELMHYFEPAYPDVIAHHVTLAFGVEANHPLPPEVKAAVVGFVDDGEGVQALIVRINGSTQRPDGGTYHITWSIDRSAGRKPVDSNAVINKLDFEKLVMVVPLQLIPFIDS